MIEYRRISRETLTDGVKSLLIDLHADAFGDEMENPFHQRFGWFVDRWGAREGFDCVVAYEADEPIGFAYGAPAEAGSEWWRNHWITQRADVSTFAFSELAVRPRWRKAGAGLALHDELLRPRAEAISVLLVDSAHPKVMGLYSTWGYQKVGVDRPFADAPLYAVMIKELR